MNDEESLMVKSFECRGKFIEEGSRLTMKDGQTTLTVSRYYD